MNDQPRGPLAQRLARARSRRQLLGAAAKTTVGGLGAAMIAPGLGSDLFDRRVALDALAQGLSCPATGEVFVRRNIHDLKAPEIASLRRGVAEMMRRSAADSNDRTGWLFQANLHVTPAILTPNPLWCQHRSWFFLPWHRMYLYWFERILRDAAGDPTLTLPYWNYSDDAAQRVLPLAFREELDPDGNPNPLYTPRRNQAINDAVNPQPLFTADYSDAFIFTNFFAPETAPVTISFGGVRLDMPDDSGPAPGQLEATPHGDVHIEVGDRRPARVDFDRPFPTVGAFSYHCELHPEMTGTVNVVDDPGLPVGRYGVQIVDNAFAPADRTIPVGSWVNWTNLGDSPHTVTADDGSFDSDTLEPAGLMFFPQLAARDPIFWLHHCNIDRLWQRWLALGGGRLNPTGEVEWMKQGFPFYDIDGTQTREPMLVEQVVDPTGCLGYRYDDPATEINRDGASPVAGVTGAIATPAADVTPELQVLGESDPEQPIELRGERVTTVVELPASAAALVVDTAVRAATPIAGAAPPLVTISLEGMRYQGGPPADYGVYVNLPEEMEADPNGDYFVGSIYLFGLLLHFGHDMPDDGMRQDFVINPVVQRLHERREWQGDPVITFATFEPGRSATRGAQATPEVAATQDDIAARPPTISIERVTISAVE